MDMDNCLIFQELSSIKWQVAYSKQKAVSFMIRLWSFLLKHRMDVKVNKGCSENNRINVEKNLQGFILKKQ